MTAADNGHRALLAALGTLVLITVATNTTAALAQPQIGAEFGAGPADTGWVVFGYSATFAVATALFGGIATHVGLVRALVAGVSLLGIGSLIAAAAPSLEVLIASRLLQGAGSGAIPTLAGALIARRFHARDRTKAFGVIVAAVGGGQAVGPIIGGLLLELIGWRAAVSIGVVAIPAVLVVARTQRGRADAMERRAIDGRGAVLVAVLALSLAFLLNRLPVLGLVPITVVPLAALLAAAVALARRTLTVPEGFVPARVVAAPVFRRVVALGAIGMSAYLGSIVLVPVVASRAYDLDGIVLGLLLLPMAAMAAVTSPNAARVEARLGPSRTTRLALACLAVGAGGLSLGAVAFGPPAMLVALAFLGTGFGLLNAPLLNELTHAYDAHDQPIAVGLYNLCFFLGGATGAALSSALVQTGLELPLLGSALVPGFATAELLLMIGPLAFAVLGVRREAVAYPEGA